MTAMKLHRYPSPSGGVALGKIGAGVSLVKRLPYDAEVEYLESTGTQYIDTGLLVTDNDRVDCTFALMAYTNTCGFGARQRTSDQSLAVWAYTQNERTIRYDFIGVKQAPGNAPIITSIYPAIGQYYTTSKVGIRNFLDGVEIDSNAITPPYTPSYSLYLFAMNNGGTASFIGNLRVSRFSIEGKRDFIPVRVGNVGYMYDRVSGRLFGNEGTGDFVLGPDVVPVEWLEGGQLNSGIAFIDTGYMPNSSTKIESTAAIFSAWGYSGRFGNQSRLTFGAGNGSLYLAQGNHYYLGGYTVGTFYSFVNDIANRTVSVEGVGSTSTTAVSNWYPQQYPVYLFASNVAPNNGTTVNGKPLDTNSIGRIRMKSCSIWENNTPAHKFLPVRVGSGSTWVGAMMDVLTRRIYRNAGTGAFAYGHDIQGSISP